MKVDREKETLLIKQPKVASSLKGGTRVSGARVEEANISLSCQGARVEYLIVLHGD